MSGYYEKGVDVLKNKDRAGSHSTIFAILLGVLIIVQIVLNTYSFAVKKTAYHEDENLSYGLANSYDRPFLYGSSLQVPDNYDIWMTGKDFYDYERTDENTRFRYDNVWSNLSQEVHPPLYYAVIHTISSVFTGKFSWWYAYIVNVICLIVTQIFLFLLASRLCRSRAAGLLVCAFWGFSLAGQSNFIFLRNYGMLTMFMVIYAYLALSLLDSEKPRRRDYIWVCVIAFLGAMTQHFFLVTAFVITLLECLYLFAKRKVKKAFFFGLSTLAGVLLSFAAFPATFEHLKSGRIKYSGEPSLKQFHGLFSSIIVKELTGFRYISTEWFIYFWTSLLLLIILSLPLLFLFRNEKWMKRLRQGTVSRIKSIPHRITAVSPGAFILLAASVTLYIVVASTVYYPDFDDGCDRYFFMAEPLLITAAASFIFWLIRKFDPKAVRYALMSVTTAAVTALILFQNIRFEPEYLIKAAPKNGTVNEYVSGNSCILLVQSAIFLPCFCRMMENADDIYVTIYADEYFMGEAHEAEYHKLFERNEEFYVVVDSTLFYNDSDLEKYNRLLNVDKEDMDMADRMFMSMFKPSYCSAFLIGYFEDLSGYKGEFVTTEHTHGNDISVYRFTPAA